MNRVSIEMVNNAEKDGLTSLTQRSRRTRTHSACLHEDILILEKRLSIGNKWSEIGEQRSLRKCLRNMPGRTENNVKNRFNMMYKNIKDEFIKNRNHDGGFGDPTTQYS